MKISFEDIVQTGDPGKALKVYTALMMRDMPNQALLLEQAWGVDGYPPQKVSEHLEALAYLKDTKVAKK